MTDTPERICEFALPGTLRDRLIAAVLRGEKTATSSLLVEWEEEGQPLPAAGERQRIVDSDGQAIAVIELLAVNVLRLGDVDLRLALEEGEGFRSVEQWRESHERFWNQTRGEDSADASASALDDSTLVVAERFRLVEQLAG